METFEELGSAHPIRSSPIFVYIHHKNLFRVGNVLTKRGKMPYRLAYGDQN
jgi:hypothetical protein